VHEQVGRVGGTNDLCHGGIVTLGYGLGEYLQLRVRPPGDAFDPDEMCSVALDDGTPVDLPPALRLRVLEQALQIDGMSKHWRPEMPGRDPLRVVKTAAFPDQPQFKMFGSPAVWIAPSAATPGSAYLEVTRLDSTKTRIEIEFRYPVEGVSAQAVFRRPSDDDTRLLHLRKHELHE
jgi:hypothetical protein